MSKIKEQKILELVSEALDSDQYVSLHFTQFNRISGKLVPVRREDVEYKAQEYADLLDAPYTHNEHEVANDFSIKTHTVNIIFSYLTAEQYKDDGEE